MADEVTHWDKEIRKETGLSENMTLVALETYKRRNQVFLVTSWFCLLSSFGITSHCPDVLQLQLLSSGILDLEHPSPPQLPLLPNSTEMSHSLGSFHPPWAGCFSQCSHNTHHTALTPRLWALSGSGLWFVYLWIPQNLAQSLTHTKCLLGGQGRLPGGDDN